MTIYSSRADSQRNDPYFSDWARMGLPEGRGLNSYTARLPVAVPPDPKPEPVPPAEPMPGRRRAFPKIDESLSDDEKRKERNRRNRVYMAAKRNALRVNPHTSVGYANSDVYDQSLKQVIGASICP